VCALIIQQLEQLRESRQLCATSSTAHVRLCDISVTLPEARIDVSVTRGAWRGGGATSEA